MQSWSGRLMISVLAVGVAVARPVAPRADADDNRAAFRVLLDGQEIPWRTMAFSVMPASRVQIEVDDPEAVIEPSVGALVSTTPGRWRWSAPETPGDADIRVRVPGGGHDVYLHAFILVPRARATKGVLNGYRIGEYPARPLKGNPIYRPPQGFVQVTGENADTRVSPNFRLKQFLAKQSSGYPKYVVLQTPLLIKLEYVLSRVRAEGHAVDTLTVMSGYRTPFYNKAIGNTTTYSQHAWGSAVDVYVDRDGDDVMDDLNGDRRVDKTDAQVLARWAEQIGSDERLLGGLSAYPGTRAHGPFVHLDVRGFKARW